MNASPSGGGFLYQAHMQDRSVHVEETMAAFIGMREPW
jgi:hypothetical protein